MLGVKVKIVRIIARKNPSGREGGEFAQPLCNHTHGPVFPHPNRTPIKRHPWSFVLPVALFCDLQSKVLKLISRVIAFKITNES